jgi:hypothetical protein
LLHQSLLPNYDAPFGRLCRLTEKFSPKFTSLYPTVVVTDLKQDFRVQPKDVTPASGDTAVLECDPPKGHPEPFVVWHKNGQPMPADEKKR